MFSRGGIFQTETEEWVFSRLRHRWLETGIPGKENRMFKGQEIKKRKCSMIRDMIRPKARGEGSGTHSSTLAWKLPGTEEPGRLQSMRSRRL